MGCLVLILPATWPWGHLGANLHLSGKTDMIVVPGLQGLPRAQRLARRAGIQQVATSYSRLPTDNVPKTTPLRNRLALLVETETGAAPAGSVRWFLKTLKMGVPGWLSR